MLVDKVREDPAGSGRVVVLGRDDDLVRDRQDDGRDALGEGAEEFGEWATSNGDVDVR